MSRIKTRTEVKVYEKDDGDWGRCEHEPLGLPARLADVEEAMTAALAYLKWCRFCGMDHSSIRCPNPNCPGKKQ